MIDLPSTIQETDHTCGPAALRGICAYYGVGPGSEAEVFADVGCGVDGSDPVQLRGAARRYGLMAREYRPMSGHELARCLDRGHPVLMMLQAWPQRPVSGFEDVWDTGHWVVAIAHDARGVTFADPSVVGARGFLTHAELDERWHDIEGVERQRVQRYGLELWRQRVVQRERLTRVVPIR